MEPLEGKKKTVKLKMVDKEKEFLWGVKEENPKSNEISLNCDESRDELHRSLWFLCSKAALGKPTFQLQPHTPT